MNDDIMEGHIYPYVMAVQSGITVQVCKVHIPTVFLTEVLKGTAS